MPIDPKAVLGAADRLRSYEREMLASLVARRSVLGEPSDIHGLCAEQLDRLGMEVELVTPRVGDLESHPEWCPPQPDIAEPEGLVSVVASRGNGPGILLFAHIDTERPDPGAGWDTDPYRATEIGGRIHGLGAADDKAGVVSVLAAARVLVPHLEGVRLVIGLVHGKLGGGLGTLPAMERVGDLEASVYCHPAGGWPSSRSLPAGSSTSGSRPGAGARRRWRSVPLIRRTLARASMPSNACEEFLTRWTGGPTRRTCCVP